MGVLLQGFYKRPPNQAVPSPASGDRVDWWWDHLARQASALRGVGFTAVWLPPVLKTSDGNKVGSDGYGPFDDYDIGSKNQWGAIETRYGRREQLQRCAAIFRANNLDIYLDMVEHQRDGDPGNFVFRYKGANDVPGIGRFPKSRLNFVPNVPRDPHLGGPVADDISFGRELAPINGKPAGYVMTNLIEAADWLTRALDAQGYRIDDVKGLSTDFLFPFLNSKSMAGKFAVGEFFDGNPAAVSEWIFNPQGMRGRASAFDFPLKFTLTRMCNNAGSFDMSSLDHAGLVGFEPLNAVTFVENHDTDLAASEAVVFNKLLAYAYILTSEGYPCVYYRDYSTDPGCYGLKPDIDNLIWIHEKIANGPTEQRWKDFNAFAYERSGGDHLLVGLNNDIFNPRTITVATGFGANVALHDYSGHAGDVRTDGNGSVTIHIPKNDNGHGYVCYSRSGIAGTGFPAPAEQSVTQDFEGAADLDIGPADNTEVSTVGQIWARGGTPIAAILRCDQKAWTNQTQVALQLVNAAGEVLAGKTFTLATPPEAALTFQAPVTGSYFFHIRSFDTPTANAKPSYKLSVTYVAPLQLD